MIVVRTFSNSDPPKLVELWNHQPAVRGLAQPMNVSLLESQVLAKPYFEPQDLLVAEVEGRIVGLAHVIPRSPWQADRDRAHIAAIPLMLVGKAAETSEVEDALLKAAETRVVEAGGTQIQLGGLKDAGPFYFGLVTGSCNRGIPASDTRMNELAQRHGYTPTGEWTVYERTLRGFRPPVDRTQISARRSLNVLREDDPPYTDFRDACTFMHQHRTQYTLVQKQDGAEVTHLSVVEMEAFSHLRGVRLAGIIDPQQLETCTDAQAKFFLAEVLRQLTEEGTAVAETQIANSQAILKEVVEALGFTATDQVRLYAKQLA